MDLLFLGGRFYKYKIILLKNCNFKIIYYEENDFLEYLLW